MKRWFRDSRPRPSQLSHLSPVFSEKVAEPHLIRWLSHVLSLTQPKAAGGLGCSGDWVAHPYSQGSEVRPIRTLQTKNGKPQEEIEVLWMEQTGRSPR